MGNVQLTSILTCGERTVDKYPDLDKATGMVIDDLMYKHWDEWVQTVPHPFVADFDGNKVGTATDIMEGEPHESPMKPFGGIEQLAWSNDSKQIAYTCRKKTGLVPFLQTLTSIFTTSKAKKQEISAKKMLQTRTWDTTLTLDSRRTEQ